MSSLTRASQLESKHLGEGGANESVTPHTHFSLKLIWCVLSPFPLALSSLSHYLGSWLLLLPSLGNSWTTQATYAAPPIT